MYSILEGALLTGQNNNSGSNLQVIADAFFPKRKLEPICVPIKYSFICNDSQALEGEQQENPVHCVLDYNPTFLWTNYDVTDSIGTLLFSYSHNGIAVKGFEWEKSCLVDNKTEIVLEIATLGYDMSLLDDCLGDLTAQVCSSYVSCGMSESAESLYGINERSEE